MRWVKKPAGTGVLANKTKASRGQAEHCNRKKHFSLLAPKLINYWRQAAMQKNTQKLLQHLPILLSLNPANLPVKTILALGKVKYWHFSPLFPKLSQKQWQQLLFRKQIRLLCLVTLLPQVLEMSAFIQHFVKGFGNHQNEKCEYITHSLCVYYAQHQERKWQTGENCARVVTNGQFLTWPYWM